MVCAAAEQRLSGFIYISHLLWDCWQLRKPGLMTQPDLHSLFALGKQGVRKHGSIPLLLERPSRQLQHAYTSGRRILASELQLNNYAETPFHSTCFTASSVSIKTAFHCGQLLRISTQQCSASPSCLSVQVQSPQEILWHLESCQSLGSCAIFEKIGCENEGWLIKEVYLKGRSFWDRMMVLSSVGEPWILPVIWLALQSLWDFLQIFHEPPCSLHYPQVLLVIVIVSICQWSASKICLTGFLSCTESWQDSLQKTHS